MWLNEPLLALHIWVNCLLLLLSLHLLQLLFRGAPAIHEVQLFHLRQLASRHTQLSCIDLFSACIFVLLLFLSIHQQLRYLEVLLGNLLKINNILLEVSLVLQAALVRPCSSFSGSATIIRLRQILPLLVEERS